MLTTEHQLPTIVDGHNSNANRLQKRKTSVRDGSTEYGTNMVCGVITGGEGVRLFRRIGECAIHGCVASVFD